MKPTPGNAEPQLGAKTPPAKLGLGVPNLPHGYKQTEVGVIPEDWESRDISDLCQLQRGFDITEATRKTGDIPVYSSSGLSYFHNEAKVQPPAVITGRKGMLGRVFFVEVPCWPHDTTLWVKDFKRNDPRYVSMFLGQFRLERFDAATSVPTLNRNNVVGVPIPIPPLPEQRAIATALSDVDALLAALDRLIAKKRDLKQAAMQQLLTGQTRLPGFEVKPGYKQTEIGAIPEDWEEQSVRAVCKLVNGRGFKPHEWKKNGLPIIRIQNLNGSDDFNYFEGPYAKKIEVEKGQLLFAWSGSRGTSFGPHIWKGSMGLLNYHTWKVQVDERAISSDFFLHALKQLTKFIEDRAHGASALVHTQKWEMEGFTFPMPATIPEQTAIASILSEMDAELAALEQRRDKTRALKQGMMQELLTGRTRLVESGKLRVDSK